MNKWVDINKEGMTRGIVCEVKTENGQKHYAVAMETEHCSGIALVKKRIEGFYWDGMTWLMKVTHWRDI